MSASEELLASAKREAQKLLQDAAVRPSPIGLERMKSVLTEAAERGDTESQNLVGAIALEIEQHADDAFSWFSRSAAVGDYIGLRSLGYLYATGTGVSADMAEAVRLYRAAAAGGDLYAMYNLAAANLRAEGEYCSFSETLELLTRAARSGIPEAAAELGDALARVDRDEEAASWYRKAALAGHAGAMNALGAWYRDGILGAPDLVESLHWFLEMLNYGNGDGMHEAVQIAPLMSPAQVREGARRAGREAEGEALLI